MQLSRALFCLFLSSFGCAAARGPAGLAAGDTLEFELPDLGGARVADEDLRGKVVLVDLWATWCEPCKVSMPFYASLFEQHQREGFAVVAISVDVHQDDVARFVESESLPFIVLHDPKGTVPEKIGILTLPTMLLLDRDGKIAYVHAGFAAADKERIAALVEEALKISGPSTEAPGDRPR